MLACIGEQFTDGDEVNGIAVVIRSRGDRIELWSRTASNEAAQVRGKAVQLSRPGKAALNCTRTQAFLRAWLGVSRKPGDRLLHRGLNPVSLCQSSLPRAPLAPAVSSQTMVGKQLKQFLDISDSQKIGFSVFVSLLVGRWELGGTRGQWMLGAELGLAFLPATAH